MTGIKRDALDTLFSDCVRERAAWSCEAMDVALANGCSQQLDCAHIHSRRHQYLRHDPMNAVSLCNAHHRYFTDHPTVFTAWLQSYVHVGEWAVEVLIEKLQHRHKWRKGMKADARAHYRGELKRMKSLRADGVLGRIEFVGYL